MSEDRDVRALIELFADLPDARVTGRCDHDLPDIVVLALCAVISGADGRDDIEAWGVSRQDWLRQYLRLRNGIPGYDTIRRVFESLSPVELQSRFAQWAQGVCGALRGQVIAIDIRLRNAALNFSYLRRLAINLFRADTSRKLSLPGKRKLASWEPDYLAQVLNLRKI